MRKGKGKGKGDGRGRGRVRRRTVEGRSNILITGRTFNFMVRKSYVMLIVKQASDSDF